VLSFLSTPHRRPEPGTREAGIPSDLKGNADRPDELLVAGEPPLTHAVVDLYQRMWEWTCEVRMTPEQARQFRQHVVTSWKKRDEAGNRRWLAAYRALEKDWRGIVELEGADRDRGRAQLRARWVAALRRSTGQDDRLLVSLCDVAYRPGGPKNPVLVFGEPPLTQAVVDLDAAVLELLLDLRLSDEQRREIRQLWIEDWKSWGPGTRRRNVQEVESWAGLPTWNNYHRSVMRALHQPNALTAWAKEAGAGARWRQALHAATSRPGSASNPVLAGGEPPLTRVVVARYADYLEVMLDLSVSGGLTAPQRQALQDYLVKDWATMSADDRAGLLGDVKRWEDAAAAGDTEANRSLRTLRPDLLAHLSQSDAMSPAVVAGIRTLRPKLLAQLSAARDAPRSRWLLEVLAHERRLAKQREDARRIRDGLCHYLGSAGRWESNPRTGSYDWVPGR
jgi:hypothetical protein